MTLDTFAQFKILELTLPNTHPVVHTLFIRSHQSKKVDDDLPQGRTLFITNLPVDATDAHLARLFRKCGSIEKIYYKNYCCSAHAILEPFQDFSPSTDLRHFHTSGGKAYVVFKQEKSLEKVLQMKKRVRVWSDQVEDNVQDTSSAKPLGITKWISEYLSCIPDAQQLEDKINQELLDFEELELKMKKEALAKRNLPDEDGFVTVTRARGRRNTNRDGHGAVVSAVNPALVKDLKPKEKGLVDFYRFQMRENKRNQLIELRKRFEQDKLKIAELRKSRKFKPY